MVRNAWFWGCIVLTATNVGAVSLWWGERARRAPTRVLRVTPDNLQSTRTPLRLTFSRPMVPPEEAGRAPPPASAFALTPTVEIAARWPSPTTLELHAKNGFRKATRYELRVPAALLDGDGYPLTEDVVHHFSTEPLAILAARQVGLSRNWQATLEIAFNDAVPASSLVEAVEFLDDSGAPISAKCVTRAEAAGVFRFRTDAVARKKVVVVVKPGLRGVSGPLGLPQIERRTVDIEPGLHLREVSGSSQGLRETAVDLRFSLAVDPAVAKDHIRVTRVSHVSRKAVETKSGELPPEPNIPFVIEGRRVRGAGSTLRLRGAFLPEASYRVDVRRGLPAAEGRFLAEDAQRLVTIPALPPSLGFVGDGRYLTEGGSEDILLRSMNLGRIRVEIERIFPNNIVAFLGGAARVGEPVKRSTELTVHAPRNEAALTPLDVGALVGDWKGPIELVVHSTEKYWPRAERRLTLTDLGIHVKMEARGLLIWVVRLSSAEAVAGAQVEVRSRTNQVLHSGATNAEGVVHFDGVPPEELGAPWVVTAAASGDLCYLPLDDPGVSTSGLEIDGRPHPESTLDAFVYAERGVARPGESVHARAVVRTTSFDLPPAGLPLRWEILRPDGTIATSRAGPLSAYGTTEIAWESENYHPTGRYRARLRVPGGGKVLGEVTFRLEEFLPETIRVRATAVDRRFSAGDALEVTVEAEHLFGASAKGLTARVGCRLVATEFSHSRWPGVRFFSRLEPPPTGSVGTRARDARVVEQILPTQEIALDDTGRAQLRFKLPASLAFASGARAVISASVLDVGGRATRVEIARDVDPLPYYIGLREIDRRQTNGSGDPGGGPREFEIVAIHPDGTPATVGNVEARFVRVHWSHRLAKDPNSATYRWKSDRVEAPVHSTAAMVSDGSARLRFEPRVGGHHELWVTVKPERESQGKDQPNTDDSALAKLVFWVSGGNDDGAPLEAPQRIVLTPDRPFYRDGDVARIRVDSPITGLALLTDESDRVHGWRTFPLEARQSVLEVPISETIRHGSYATLTVVRSSLEPGSLGAPVRAYGAVALRESPLEKQGELVGSLPDGVAPQTSLELDLTLTRPDGSPEQGEVTLALVDAGILALTGFRAPDPVEFFTAQRALGTRSVDVYSRIVPEPDALLATPSSAAGGGGDLAGLLNPVASSRVQSVALWVGPTATDANGRVQTIVDVPDFDGELVAMAVASGETTVASFEHRFKVRRALVLSPRLPRVLAPGDTCRIPLELHNTTEHPDRFLVDLIASESLHSEGGAAGREVAVPANGEATLWFDLEAGKPGIGNLRFRARRLGDSEVEDEFERKIELPVRPAAPPTVEQQTTTIEGGASRSLQSKTAYLAGTERSELVLSTSPLPKLEGSLRYLLEYPHGCLEQTTSKLLPWVALADYLADNLETADTADLSRPEIAARVQAGVARILSMQTADGGLAAWPGAREAYPYGTLYATTVLLEARAAGYEIPSDALRRLLDHIEGILASPKTTDPERTAEVRAQALAILARSGRDSTGWLQVLHDQRATLTDEGRAHLALAKLFHAERSPELAKLHGKRMPWEELQRQAVDGSPLGSSRELDGFLYSRTRELCVVLSALVDLGRSREEILPYVQRLEKAHRGRAFRSTQEDGLFVLALSKAAKLFPTPAEPLSVRVGLPGGASRVHAVGQRLKLPVTWTKDEPLTLALEGTGTLYAFLETRGVPTEIVPEMDHALKVRRRFLRPDGVPYETQLTATGSPKAIRFQQGDACIVEILVDAPRDLPNVAIIDPLPAGLEIENPNFLSAERLAQKSRAVVDMEVSRTERRDDRLVLFTHLRQGSNRYRYLARAVTQGRFALPPIQAECMYDSGQKSTHGAGTIVVVPREDPTGATNAHAIGEDDAKG